MTRGGRRISDADGQRSHGAGAPAACAVAFLVLVLAALLSAHDTAAQGIQVQITECGSAGQPAGCSTGSQRVQRDRGEQRIVVPVAPKPKPASRPAAASANGAERHDVDLETGE